MSNTRFEQKYINKQSGFGVVGLLLTIVVLALVAGGGIYIYHKDHKTKVAVTTSTTKTSTSSTAKNASGTTTATNPYAGWKTYCDTVNGYCFKYPASWRLDNESQAGITNLVVDSPSGGGEITYQNTYSADALIWSSFHATTDTTLSAGNGNLSVVGGYTLATEAYMPLLYVVDTSCLQANPVTIGQTGTLSCDRFTDASDKDYQGLFSLEDPQASADGNGSFTASQSAAWLNTQDATTGLLILKSLYYQRN